MPGLVDMYGRPLENLNSMRMAQTKTIKHAEENSSVESLKYQPWRVTLSVVRNDNMDKIEEAVYYCRAPSPMTAAWMSMRFWKVWECDQQGVPPTAEYPDIAGEQEAARISESEYMQEWKMVQRTCPEYKYVGPPENPSCFVGWSLGRPKPYS